ncbi:MAG: RNA-binding S4 domain-containing protein [Bacteroidota bacterium]
MAVAGVRIDKWLWAVRIFKTRTMASDACRCGKVIINDVEVKPSREVKAGDVIIVKTGPIRKTLKVLNLLENRVSAKLVAQFIEDMTPAEEYKKLEMMRDSNFVTRNRGAGRPTKRERRDIDKNFPEW